MSLQKLHPTIQCLPQTYFKDSKGAGGGTSNTKQMIESYTVPVIYCYIMNYFKIYLLKATTNNFLPNVGQQFGQSSAGLLWSCQGSLL